MLKMEIAIVHKDINKIKHNSSYNNLIILNKTMETVIIFLLLRKMRNKLFKQLKGKCKNTKQKVLLLYLKITTIISKFPQSKHK